MTNNKADRTILHPFETKKMIDELWGNTLEDRVKVAHGC